MLNPQFVAMRRYLDAIAREGRVCGIVRGTAPEETLAAEEPRFIAGVHYIEGETLQARSLGRRDDGDQNASGFRFFLDGVQFSHVVAYEENAPIVHLFAAAAILQRDPASGRLHVWAWTGPRECFLMPFRYTHHERLEQMGARVEDTMDKSPDAAPDTQVLRALAHSKSQRVRRKLEVDLIQRWVAAGEEGWLMVDGPLMLLPEVPLRARMAGVVKSFGAQFFQGAEQLRVITLAERQRTTLFQLPRGSRPLEEDSGRENVRRWYSWYVRVRDRRNREPDFGLLRVETPPDLELPEQADEISRWLIAERAPLSTPDPRWANLLYPIHACERFLKSSLPGRDRVSLQLH